MAGTQSRLVQVGSAGVLTLAVLAGLSQWEGTRYVPYKDVVGVLTVCKGITNAALPGFVVTGKKYTPAECQAAEEKILTEQIMPEVTRCRAVPVTQRQLDQLYDFAWNIGSGRLCSSTLMKRLNAGDCRGAGAEFLRWDRAGGRVYKGLADRRSWESWQFLADCPGTP